MATSPYAGLTQSQQTLALLQAKFGTQQPGNIQIRRNEFYSTVDYPSAGASQLNFFGSAIGNSGQTYQDTNLPVAGSFGTSSFLLKSINIAVVIPLNKDASYVGTDATMVAGEFLNGFVQAGVFELNVNAKNYVLLPLPLLYAPPADGRGALYGAGLASTSFVVNTPNVQQCRRYNLYLNDPELFIEAQQNFSATISYPSGAVPLTATANSLAYQIKISLSGVEFRPAQ